ncbi:hypothetical protein [Streptomyces sp. NPDC001781]
MRLWPRRKRRAPVAVVPDRTRIALLEYELYGIEPAPGSTAAAVIGLRQFGAALRGDADRSK